MGKLFNPEMTIREGRRVLNKKVEAKKQVVCPMCKRKAGPDRRKLQPKMVFNLVQFYRHDKFGTATAAEALGKPEVARSGDYAKLAYWGLMEVVRPGLFRMTKKGRLFVRGRATVPEYALLYRRRFFGLEGDQVSIFDCLGKYDYKKLMKGGY